MENLRAIMGEAQGLEAIELDLPPEFQEDGDAFTDIFVNRFWPRLEKLELSFTTALPEDLVKVAKAHAGTLRRLHLHYFTLHTNDEMAISNLVVQLYDILSLETAEFKDDFVSQLDGDDDLLGIELNNYIMDTDILLGEALRLIFEAKSHSAHLRATRVANLESLLWPLDDLGKSDILERSVPDVGDLHMLEASTRIPTTRILLI